MNREEKIKLIKGFSAHLANKGGLLASNFEQEVELYLDSLEMNKEKAIKIMNDFIQNKIAYGNTLSEAIQFAIDYMKDEDETIIGYANYYPTGTISQVYKTLSDAKFYKGVDGKTIPIRLPKQ